MIFHGETINNEPAANWPVIQAECARHQKFTVEVTAFNSEREISNQQMKYLHAVVFPLIADRFHMSELEAEDHCKALCGERWFVKKIGDKWFRLSKRVLSVKDCNKWIENIYTYFEKQGLHIPAPNQDWRKEQNGKL